MADQLSALRARIIASDPSDWHILEDSRAVMRDRLSTAIGWGPVEMDFDATAYSDVLEDVDPSFVALRVYWYGSPVDSLLLIQIRHSYLPSPRRLRGRLYADSWSVGAARVLNGLVGSVHNFEREMALANIGVKDEKVGPDHATRADFD